jgi:excisionase family DNA binding protein
MSESNDLVSAQALAKFLKCSDKHIRNLARKKGMPHVRVGRVYRFSWPQVRQWLMQQTWGEDA